MYARGLKEMLRLVLFAILTSWQVPTVNCQQTACSAGLSQQGCLTAVRTLMADESRFWFGQNYDIVCPPQRQLYGVDCINNDKIHRSIITRARNSSDNRTDMIRQVLNVTFDAPAGSYESCGKSYSVEPFTMTIDPSVSTRTSLWSLDHVPHVSWTAEPNKLYTLIVWDSGSIILHGLAYNILGSTWDNERVLWNYRGPKNIRDRDQPYVFLLYEQSSALDASSVSNTLMGALLETFVSPSVFVSDFSLTGPVGVSVLTVTTDPYAVAFQKQNRILNMCPVLLTPSFSQLPLSYNVSNEMLTSSVDVTFKSPEISVRSCCSDFVKIVSNVRVPNPLENGLISPVYTRNQPEVTLVAGSFFDTFYFFRNMFTLLMLDVTDELSGASDPNTVLLWGVTNMREGKVAWGDTTAPYQEPLPLRGQGRKTILFLLLQQTMVVNGTAHFASNNCETRERERCRFNLTAFITDNSLKIDGANWFRSSHDSYSRQRAVSLNVQSEEDACYSIPGYATPCPSTSTGGCDVTTRAPPALMALSLMTLCLLSQIILPS